MKQIHAIFAKSVLSAMVIMITLTGCSNPFFPAPKLNLVQNPPKRVHKVMVEGVVNGTIIARPDEGPEGMIITLLISPEPGYRLESDSLQYTGNGISQNINDHTRTFALPGFDVSVKANFIPVPEGNHSVSVAIGDIKNGTITANPEYGEPGNTITLTVRPDSGYKLQPGSLKFFKIGENAEEGTPIDELTHSFELPAENVIISAQFEEALGEMYTVSAANVLNGSIYAYPEYSRPGTPVIITVSPEPGFRLKPGTLQYGNTAIDEWTRIFDMPAEHIIVTAEFEALPENIYSISTGKLSGGTVAAFPEYGNEGAVIALTVTPYPGFAYKNGSLNYYTSSDSKYNVDDNSREFSLPASHVWVSAEFEKLPSGVHTVSVSRYRSGRITAVPEYGAKNSKISLKIEADRDFNLKKDSLMYRDAFGNHPIDAVSKSFEMPDSDVRILAEFAPSNANLKDIRINGKTIWGFSQNKTDYYTHVPLDKTTAEISAAPAHPDAAMQGGSVKLNGLESLNGKSISISVTAADGTTVKTYKVTVIRELFPMTTVPSGTFKADKGFHFVSAFSIGETEITHAQWEKVMSQNPSIFQSNPPLNEKQPNRPVENISWDDAVQFCNALSAMEHKTPVYTINKTNKTVTADWNANGYRLPTEMEWLWAAMGADANAAGKTNTGGYYLPFAGYDGSGSRINYAWHGEDKITGRTHEVKKLKPNQLKLYDMTGNVNEWCWDWESAFPDFNTWDYHGPANGVNKVIKGANFGSNDFMLALNYREDKNKPDYHDRYTGLRITYRSW